MIEFSYKMRVEFYDVDSMNVVWHGNYVKFLEAARCAFLRDLGYDYNDFARQNYALPIIKMEFKFIAPAFFGDELDIKVRLKEYLTTLKFEYEIRDKNKNLITKAATAQACVDMQTRTTMFELPSGFYKAIKDRYES